MLHCLTGAERKNSIAEFLESIEKSDFGEASGQKDERNSEASDSEKVKKNISTKNYFHREEEKKHQGKKFIRVLNYFYCQKKDIKMEHFLAKLFIYRDTHWIQR